MTRCYRIGKHLLYLLLVLWCITLVTYALFALTPGNPAEIILRDRYEAPDPAQVEALGRELGLHLPWWQRYLTWLCRVCRGDWGVSWRNGLPVWEEIYTRLPATLELAAAAFGVVVVISTLLGVIAALRRERLADRLIQAATIFLSAMPAYFFGLLLILLFSVKIRFFPVAGRGDVNHLVLPALTLGVALGVLQARVLRATLVQIMATDYIRFAVAKGLNPWQVFTKHMVRNALPPMATMWGVALGQLLGGAVIVESIFAWPGLGRLTLEAVLARDIPVVQAIVLLLATIFVVVNRSVDVIHRRLDPKVGRL